MITIATAAMIMTRITSAYHASFISPKGIFTVSSQFTLLVVTIVDLLLIRSKFSVTQQARKWQPWGITDISKTARFTERLRKIPRAFTRGRRHSSRARSRPVDLCLCNLGWRVHWLTCGISAAEVQHKSAEAAELLEAGHWSEGAGTAADGPAGVESSTVTCTVSLEWMTPA